MPNPENLLDLSGKVALVTGGSRGIGEAVALTLAAHGANVVINSREGSRVKGEEVVEKIRSYGVEGLWIPGDISRQEVGDSLVKETVGKFARLDILVNNAGITDDNIFIRMNDEQIDSVLNTNLRGTMRVTRAALKVMIRQRNGSIVSMSSVVAHGNSGQANYAASKAGIEGFTRSIALEYAKRGIRVNAVAGGPIDTDMLNVLTPEQRESLIGLVPIGRVITPGEVANTILFLVSDMSSGITGQVVNVDGGMIR